MYSLNNQEEIADILQSSWHIVFKNDKQSEELLQIKGD